MTGSATPVMLVNTGGWKSRTVLPVNRRYVGALLTPSARGLPDWPCLWAADNEAFTASGFNETKFVSLLKKVADEKERRDGFLWVACPDAPMDAARTLALFEVWSQRIATFGLSVALVGQDGMSSSDIPWSRINCLFIGGSDSFKEGDGVVLAAEARARGKMVHAGRVNSVRRLRKFWGVCHTYDGSRFSRWQYEMRWMVGQVRMEEEAFAASLNFSSFFDK